MFKVFTRADANSPFELWEDMFEVRIDEDGGMELSLFTDNGYEEAFISHQAALFSSLDLDNIPPDVRCVVCRVVTDELCEGGYILTEGSNVRLLHWYGREWMLSDIHSSYAMTNWSPVLLKPIGHALTHRIEDGEVVER